MTQFTANSTANDADRLFLGGTHPVLAIAAFIGAFLFAAIPFWADADHAVVVIPCVIACLSCSILFMRLLIGGLGPVKWILLAGAAYLCLVAGPQWYLVVMITVGTALCWFLTDRLMGRFQPLIHLSAR